MLVSMKAIVDEAKKKGYGVTAPNVYDDNTIRAAIQCAEEYNSPMILDFAYGMFGGSERFRSVSRIAVEMAEKSCVPVALNLDHGADIEQAAIAISAGLTSIMVDRSSKPFEENVADVQELVKFAHAAGVSVEAELGHVGTGASASDEDIAAGLTDPAMAAEYVERTGIDCLAVAVGTVHGQYRGEPHIHFDRIEEITKATSIPLVLHGGSSSGDENLAKACKMGVAKINLFTDLSLAGLAKVRDYGIEKIVYACDAENMFIEGYKEKLIHYMKLFGQCGQA